MGRPAKRGLAATNIVRTRLTDPEMEAFDDARGHHSEADFLRECIVARLDAMNEPLSPAFQPDEALMSPTEHRHKRGRLLAETTVKGVRKATYECSEPGCKKELRT